MSTPPPVPPDQPNIPPVPPVPPAAPAVPPPVYSGVPSYQQAPRPAPHEAPIVSPKSGLGGGTKILIFGCLGIVALGIVAMVAGGSWIWGQAKEALKDPVKMGQMMAHLHPEFEFVSGDAGTKTITMRDKATGETMTASLEDVQNGRFILKKSDGTVVELSAGGGFKATDAKGTVTEIGGGDMAPPPAWVPAYPGNSKPVMSSQTNTGGTIRGVFAFTTPDGPAEAKASMSKALTGGGYKLNENVDTPGISIVKAIATGEAGVKRVVTAMITSTDGQTQVTLNFDQSLPEK